MDSCNKLLGDVVDMSLEIVKKMYELRDEIIRIEQKLKKKEE